MCLEVLQKEGVLKLVLWLPLFFSIYVGMAIEIVDLPIQYGDFP